MNELAKEREDGLRTNLENPFDEALNSTPKTEESNSQRHTIKSLDERKEELCMRLQANRRIIAIKLVGPERHDQFPRSTAMRFISNHNTREILHKAANAALGLQTFRALRWGVSAMKFLRKSLRK